MNHEDLERFFQKLNVYNRSGSYFDKEIAQQIVNWFSDESHEQGDAMRNKCEMDEETARAKGILC